MPRYIIRRCLYDEAEALINQLYDEGSYSVAHFSITNLICTILFEKNVTTLDTSSDKCIQLEDAKPKRNRKQRS